MVWKVFSGIVKNSYPTCSCLFFPDLTPTPLPGERGYMVNIQLVKPPSHSGRRGFGGGGLMPGRRGFGGFRGRGW